MKRRLFDKDTDYMVLIFVIGMILMLAYCESAGAAEWSIEEQHDSNAGATKYNPGLDRICVRSKFDTGASVSFCPLVAISGDLQKDSFELGLADELWPRWEAQVNINRTAGDMDGGFSMRRMVGDGPFKLGIGLSYWINDSPGSDSRVTFNLTIRYTFK